MALQQTLGELYKTIQQEYPGLVDPPEGGMCGDQLPPEKTRAKTLDFSGYAISELDS